MSPDPVTDGFCCNILQGDLPPVYLAGAPACQIQFNRVFDFSTPKRGPGLACNQQGFIHIVVHDQTEFFEIIPAKCCGNGFRDTIANGIRVADTFAFHDFHRGIGMQGFYEDLAVHTAKDVSI
jgi:hypothetical protein